MNPSSLKLSTSLKLPTSPRLRWTSHWTSRRTGKMILLCTIICAGQMYGMKNICEPKQPSTGWQDLPAEVKALVLTEISKFKDSIDAINTIKALSATNKELNKVMHDEKDFSALVNLLAKAISMPKNVIAEKFNTPIAKEYTKINSELLEAIRNTNLAKVKELVELDNADPNFTFYEGTFCPECPVAIIASPFQETIIQFIVAQKMEHPNIKEILKFLFEKGMYPDVNVIGSDIYSIISKDEDIKNLFEQYGYKG